MILNVTDKIFCMRFNNFEQKVFEGEIPLFKGMSYNSYVITDNKNVLLDTCDNSVKDEFISDLKAILKDKKLDYFIIHHLEPDHTCGIKTILQLYPDVCVVTSALGMMYLKQFFKDVKINNSLIIKEGDRLDLGYHVLNFVSAQMVHWPEVFVSYEEKSKTLFSADAFGSFTTCEKLDSSDYEDKENLLKEERRYYTNIVGKYGDQVQNLLKKAAKLEIKTILALHGCAHTKRIPECVKYYDLWSRYEKEKEGVLIVYTTIYGNTKVAIDYLEKKLQSENVAYDIVCLNKEDFSIALSKTFIYDKIILASQTFNNCLYPKMREYVFSLLDHLIRNKKFALIENGSWAPQAKNLMSKYLQDLKNCSICDSSVTIKSSVDANTFGNIDNLLDELLK